VEKCLIKIYIFQRSEPTFYLTPTYAKQMGDM